MCEAEQQAMMENIEKAQILTEALPFIQKFYNKTIVIKYGGSALINPEIKETIIKDIVLMKLVGMHPVIVHGGGPDISSFLKRLEIESKFVDGLRVTSQETMEVAEMVLSGKLNKQIVTDIELHGVKAVGISGKDGGLLKVKKKYSDGQDIGNVGEITDVNPKILYDLLEKDFLPVVCPIGLDDHFESYNINADDAACAIAKAMQAEKLAFLTDIEGVYKDPSDSSTLISEMTIDEARQLLSGGFIGGGMLPKLNNCIDAIEGGVSRVHILDGRILHCLLLEIFTNKGIGTAILAKDESRCYHENE